VDSIAVSHLLQTDGGISVHALTMASAVVVRNDWTVWGLTHIYISLAVYILMVIALWPTFMKAGRPGWAALIPIYNLYNIVKIAGRPGWLVILYFIPLVNIVVHIIVALDVAKAFKKSTLFGVVGLWLFPYIGYFIVGYGSAQYSGSPNHRSPGNV
jgi:hypothetical protein